jgi:TonB family protein
MVNVVIDELGQVISAEAMPNKYVADDKLAGGEPLAPTLIDPALIEAAEDAARRAKFAPTLLNGVPVRVKGIITYNFLDRGASAVKVPVTLTGPVLNQKAEYLPSPAYPPAAIAVMAQGSVSVQVSIDEVGNVISARAVSGHPLLRSAAAAAAREARFSPTFLKGEPVAVYGVVTYNFVLPKKDDK